MGKGKDKRGEILVDQVLSLEMLPNLAAELATRFKASNTGVRLSVRTATVNIALIQLLCAAHRSAQMAGKELIVDWQAGGPVGNLLRDAGFTRHVACPRSQNGECLWLQEHWE